MIWMLFLEDYMKRTVSEQPASRNAPKILTKHHKSMFMTPVPRGEVRHILKELLTDHRVNTGEIAVNTQRSAESVMNREQLMMGEENSRPRKVIHLIAVPFQFLLSQSRPRISLIYLVKRVRVMIGSISPQKLPFVILSP
jgi:hypothetical protein